MTRKSEKDKSGDWEHIVSLLEHATHVSEEIDRKVDDLTVKVAKIETAQNGSTTLYDTKHDALSKQIDATDKRVEKLEGNLQSAIMTLLKGSAIGGTAGGLVSLLLGGGL